MPVLPWVDVLSAAGFTDDFGETNCLDDAFASTTLGGESPRSAFGELATGGLPFGPLRPTFSLSKIASSLRRRAVSGGVPGSPGNVTFSRETPGGLAPPLLLAGESPEQSDRAECCGDVAALDRAEDGGVFFGENVRKTRIKFSEACMLRERLREAVWMQAKTSH